jgi:hypothetical protein
MHTVLLHVVLTDNIPMANCISRPYCWGNNFYCCPSCGNTFYLTVPDCCGSKFLFCFVVAFLKRCPVLLWQLILICTTVTWSCGNKFLHFSPIVLWQHIFCYCCPILNCRNRFSHSCLMLQCGNKLRYFCFILYVQYCGENFSNWCPILYCGPKIRFFCFMFCV